jgi:hypothetical protein
MFDRWQDAMNQKDIRQSQFLWELCGGVRVQMTTNRRGYDPVLFKRYCDLYPYADDESHKATAIQWLRSSRIDFKPQVVCYFVLSHEKRVKINESMNSPPEGAEYLELPAPTSQYGVMMEGQAMKVWVGLE